MTSPLPTLFGWQGPKQLDLNRSEGCDHDQNVYHYRLVDGAMVLRGIVLGHGWEHRQMDWQGLSCYKRKEDDRMAIVEARTDKAEIMARAKELMDSGKNTSEAADIIGVPRNTLYGWISKAKKKAEKDKAKAKAVLDSIDAAKRLRETTPATVVDKPVRSMGCIAPIGVEVPKYEPEDNDYLDEPLPYVPGPDPLDAQIDVMLDCLWAEKKAKLKAHLKPLLSDTEAWDMVKCIVSRGLA